MHVHTAWISFSQKLHARFRVVLAVLLYMIATSFSCVNYTAKFQISPFFMHSHNIWGTEALVDLYFY